MFKFLSLYLKLRPKKGHEVLEPLVAASVLGYVGVAYESLISNKQAKHLINMGIGLELTEDDSGSIQASWDPKALNGWTAWALWQITNRRYSREATRLLTTMFLSKTGLAELNKVLPQLDEAGTKYIEVIVRSCPFTVKADDKIHRLSVKQAWLKYRGKERSRKQRRASAIKEYEKWCNQTLVKELENYLAQNTKAR